MALLAATPTFGTPIPAASPDIRLGTALGANLTAMDEGGHWNCAQGSETFAFFSHPSGGLAPFRYAWNFGDGSPSSSEADPVHTYTTPESFTVTLMIADSANATARASMVLSWGIPLSCSAPSSNWGGLVLYGVLIVGVAGGGVVFLRSRRRSPPLPPPP